MGNFTIEAFTLLGIGLCIIALRCYARWATVGWRGLKPDDYIMTFAALVYALETGAAYSVGYRWHGLANSGMTDEQRINIDPQGEEFAMRVDGSKTQLIGWSLYTLLLWTLKLSMNIFYERLTHGVESMRKRIRVSLVLVGMTYIATILSILLGCRPIHKNWQIYPDPGNVCQPAISKVDIYVTVILNVLTDLFLMSIPLPMLWQAKLPGKQKYFLLIMFSGGIFVMMAGILRCALILADPLTGAQAAGSWAVRETFVAVLIGNLPMIFPLARKWLAAVCPGWVGTGSNSSPVYERQLESHRLKRRTGGSGGEKSIGTTMGLSESEERIVGIVKNGEGIGVTIQRDIELGPRHERFQTLGSVDVAYGTGGYTAFVKP